MSNEEMLHLFEELISLQKETLLRLGREIIPHLTSDDLLQPNDYEELELNPYFRYEEGVLAGMQTVQTALFALLKEKSQ